MCNLTRLLENISPKTIPSRPSVPDELAAALLRNRQERRRRKRRRIRSESVQLVADLCAHVNRDDSCQIIYEREKRLLPEAVWVLSAAIDRRFSALKVAIRYMTHSITVTRFKAIDPPTERAPSLVSPVSGKREIGKSVSSGKSRRDSIS